MTANEQLADLARERAQRYPPRTPERRAVGMAWAALLTSKTPAAARRALDTFGDPQTRAAAAVILDHLDHHGQEAA